ncbi:MAG: hypothetical protein AB7K67_17465 [Hyphomicrobiaceae bacterium]|jgi:hypothetical protein
MSQDNLRVTPLPQRDAPGGQGDGDRLAALRAEVEDIAASVADIARKRGAEGVGLVRGSIEERPWTSLAVAGAAGALLALAVIPARSAARSRWQQLDPRNYDYDDMARSIRRSIAVETRPLAARVETLMNSLAGLDTRDITGSPMFEKAKSLLQAVTGTGKSA